MDPHSRNEAPDTDLAEFMMSFGQWWDKYGNWTLTVILIIAVGAFAWWYLTNRAYQAHEAAWANLAYSTSPEGYRQVAQNHSNPAVQALGYLRGADLLLNQAVTPEKASTGKASEGKAPGGETAGGAAQATAERTGGGATAGQAGQQPAGKPINRQAALEEAARMYKQVLQTSRQRIFRLNALSGLASVAESRRQWAQAKKRYQQVIDQAGPRYRSIADEARRRLGLLSELQTPVLFAPSPPAGEAAKQTSAAANGRGRAQTSTTTPGGAQPSGGNKPTPGQKQSQQTPATPQPAHAPPSRGESSPAAGPESAGPAARPQATASP